MDIQSKDILKQLLERMERMENHQRKLDRVIERLDTLQNILERQGQKQNLLDEMLLQLKIRSDSEKVVITEQLQGAQQEFTPSFGVMDTPGESTLFPYMTANDLGKRIDDKLISVEDKTVDTAQKCHQLTLWSRKMEDKITQLADNNTGTVKTLLVEIRSVKDLIRGQTNSELIWLNNQIDQKLTDISVVVKDLYQQQMEMKEETAHSAGQVLKTGIQQGNDPLSDSLTKDMCDKQMKAIQDLERKTDQLNSSVMDAKTSLDTVLTRNKQSIIDIENTIRNVEAGITGIENTVRNAIAEITDNSKEQSLLINETVKSELNKLFEAAQQKLQTKNKIVVTESEMLNRHQQVNKKLEEVSADLKDYICKTKREIFAVTEKEAQIVRDRIQGPLPSPGKYTFDLFVNNFKSLIRSGKEMFSVPWHINEMQTCVTGNVIMLKNGEMEVWLIYGRHALEVGLQPRPGKTLKIKATICDTRVNKLPPLDVGKAVYFMEEDEVEGNNEWGCKAGEVSCDLLIERGYGKLENYDQEALLVRYEIIVQ